MHKGCHCNSMSNVIRDLTVAKSMELRAGRKTLYGVKTLYSKKCIVLLQFKISKGEKTSNSSRAKRTEIRGNKSKESKSNWGIKISMLMILDLSF